MRTQILMVVAAASVLLTSAAFASVGGIPHETRRAGDRFTIVNDNDELMCKVAGSPSSPSYAPPAEWQHSEAYLQHEGNTRCTPSMVNGEAMPIP